MDVFSLSNSTFLDPTDTDSCDKTSGGLLEFHSFLSGDIKACIQRFSCVQSYSLYSPGEIFYTCYTPLHTVFSLLLLVQDAPVSVIVLNNIKALKMMLYIFTPYLID